MSSLEKEKGKKNGKLKMWNINLGFIFSLFENCIGKAEYRGHPLPLESITVNNLLMLS